MSIIKDINFSLRELSGYSKAYIPLFSEELITADIDAVKEAMTSSEQVRVFRQRNWLFRSLFLGFEPLVNQNRKGLILYPGAFVAPEAYAPIPRAFAERGYYAAVTTPPLELSLTDID